MALLPLFYDYNPWELQRSRYEPDVFGRGITPKEIHQLHSFPRWTNSIRQDPQIFSPTTIGKDGFQVCIDVKQFQPNEITVKTIDNNVVVEGKHEDREDEHGFIARHFVRKYILPKGYDSQHVVSTLSSDGILTIKVPLPSKDVGGNERIVQIQHTGPARLHVKEHKPEANGENGQAKQ